MTIRLITQAELLPTLAAVMLLHIFVLVIITNRDVIVANRLAAKATDSKAKTTSFMVQTRASSRPKHNDTIFNLLKYVPYLHKFSYFY